MLKAKDKDCITVFIGPCIAKKAETQDKSLINNADYALTFGEIRAMFRAKEVDLLPESNSIQEASTFGKRFGNAGGVTAAVIESLKEMNKYEDVKVCKSNGAAECKKALTLLKFGKLEEDFIEGMICLGGCVGGPSRHRGEIESKKARDQLIGEADQRGINENLKNYDMNQFSMHKAE